MRRIYLDHNATTPVRPEVLEAMGRASAELFGNPSSQHWHGQQARAASVDARGAVAALVGGQPAEIVFTGSGTEADNMALRGVAAMAREPRKTIVTSALEHHAILHAGKAVAEDGGEVVTARATPDGAVDLDDLARRVDARTALVAVMLANNETGVVQPMAEVVALARRAGALVLCDAVQAAGKIAIDVKATGVDLATLSAHKIGGPKGVGALWIKRGTRLRALLRGGSQERNRRAGTENVPGIVGFGRAAELARAELATEPSRQAALRDRLERALLQIPGAERNGNGARVGNTTNVSFAGADAESLLMALDLSGLSVSTGAACAAGAVEPSHVLRAMGFAPERVQASLRFSLGRTTTEADVEEAAPLVAAAVEKQRRVAAAPARRR